MSTLYPDTTNPCFSSASMGALSQRHKAWSSLAELMGLLEDSRLLATSAAMREVRHGRSVTALVGVPVSSLHFTHFTSYLIVVGWSCLGPWPSLIPVGQSDRVKED